eukprot:g2905.t1
MPRNKGLRLLPDPEIAVGWWNSGGREKMAPREKRALNKPKTPKKGKLFKLELDFNQAAAILPTEPIYSFGWNSSGQLGLGHTLDKGHPHSPLAVLMGPSQYEPTRGKAVAFVACGARHTAIATKHGEVFMCGRTAVGQLGLPGCKNFDTQGFLPTPMRLPLPGGGGDDDGGDGDVDGDAGALAITHLVCGASHTVVCCRRRARTGEEPVGRAEAEGGAVPSHALFTFGLNLDGQLGLGHREPQTLPALVELPILDDEEEERGGDANGGGTGTAAAIEAGAEAKAGATAEAGAGAVAASAGDYDSDSPLAADAAADAAALPRPTAPPAALQSITIGQGQGGRGAGRAPALRVTAAAAGKGHTLVATATPAQAGGGQGGGAVSSAQLWAFGSNCDGQLGTGGLISELSPVLVADADALRPRALVGEEALLAAAEVAAAEAEAEVAEEKATRAAAMYGGEGAAADEDEENSAVGMRKRAERARAEARRLAAECEAKRAAWGAQQGRPHTFTALAAGEAHSVAVLAGRVFACGGNRFGQLGLGAGEWASQRALTLVPSHEVSAWPVTQIAGGRVHTVCMNEANECYCWGNNEYGQLGTGAMSKEGVPEPMFQDDLLWEDDQLQLAPMQHSCHTVLYRVTDGLSREALERQAMEGEGVVDADDDLFT